MSIVSSIGSYPSICPISRLEVYVTVNYESVIASLLIEIILLFESGAKETPVVSGNEGITCYSFVAPQLRALSGT